MVRGVPILKDIPIIGFLFSSEDTEQRAVETIFILTPTISTDGRPKEEVMKEIQRKHEPDSPAGLGEMITDPFGFKAREEARERTLLKAEAADKIKKEDSNKPGATAEKTRSEAQKPKTEWQA